MTKYICLSCKHTFKRSGDSAVQTCTNCKGDAYWEGSGYHNGVANFHQTKDIVAINQNPKEGVYGVDSKGRHVDLKDTPYENDPTGWKRAGKDPRKRKWYNL